MRVSVEYWRSGEDLTQVDGLGSGFRGFDVSTADNIGGLQHMSTCACAGCLTKLIDQYAPENAVTPPVQQVVEPPDIPGDTSTPQTLAIGGSETGALQVFGDDDWFAVQLVAGQSYVFTLTPSGASPMQDPYLEIRNASGALAGFDDDGGPGTNSLLRWTATESGTFYINARAWEPETGASGSYTGTGSYTITAAIGAPQNPLDTINLGFAAPSHIDVYFSTNGQTQSFGPVGNQTSVTALRDWTPEEIAQAMAALQIYSAYTSLTFTLTSSQAQAEFILTLGDLDTGTLGWFATYDGLGYGAFAPDATGWTTGVNGGLIQGGLGWVTLIHEYGHGLGLAHPHDNGGVSEVMQGVTSPFNVIGTFGLNQGVYTTMSYNDGWISQFGSPNVSFGSQGTPMALDIALLQQRYGANTTANQGNNTYVLPTANLSGTFYSCIWDTGGNDTIVQNGSAGATIDLRAATLLNAVGGGGWVSSIASVRGGFTIANGVVIENATGGSGNDTLIGNSAANALNGGAGSDNMSGEIGDDVYVIDSAGDVVTELSSQGTDTVYTTVTYTLSNHVEQISALGALAINLFGNSLNNLLVGNNAINGLDGGAGADTLIGGGGNDLYLIDNIADVIIENSGEGTDDVVYTSLAFYQLGDNVEQLSVTAATGTFAVGNSVNNLIVGNSGADALDGGAGIDTLVGGAGNDSYFVDNVADVIIEGASEGAADVVYTSLAFYQLGDNVEQLSVTTAAGTYAVGNSVNNLIVGNAGADALDGGVGIDTLIGGGGNDSYFVDNVADVIIEGASEGAADVVYTSLAFYALGDNVEQLSVTTASGTYAAGNSVDNLIVGNAGADALEGRMGSDVLVGNGGADSFIYNSAAEGGDAIVDFVSGVDVIRIDASGFGGGLVAGSPVTFFSGSNPAAGAGAAFLYDTDDGRLFWDEDGVGGASAILIATLSGAPALSQSDIIVGP